jgi:protein transport protein SEC13
LGAILACASSDGKISILEYKGKVTFLFFYDWEKGGLCVLINIFCTDDGSWETQLIDAHGIGCNAVTWAPAAIPGSLVQAQGGNPTVNTVKKLVSAGCDNLIKIWGWK